MHRLSEICAKALSSAAIVLSATVVMALAPAPAAAQDYPNRPIRLVVPFLPEGVRTVSDGRSPTSFRSC